MAIIKYKRRDELEAEIKELKSEIKESKSKSCDKCVRHPDNSELKAFSLSCGECSQFYSDSFEPTEKEIKE